MSYDYATQKPNLFTDDGQRMFLKVRDAAKSYLDTAGAVSCGKLISAAGSGISWDMLACVDRLVELGELLEIPNPHSRAGQHRVFIKPYH